MMEPMMKACRLCPRQCGADRLQGQLGFCQMPSALKLARAALHMWEEPCISGNMGDDAAQAAFGPIPGSGTVFFSGCTLRCVYCQNHEIAAGSYGKEITTERLAEIFLELEAKGAANINLVTPTHYTPQIIEALDKVKHKLTIPVVSNTSGYETVETLKLWDGYIDIYLTDFKYMSQELSARYSKAPDYPEIAKQALAEMVRQTGPFQYREAPAQLLASGVIVRHLLLPGQLLDSKRIVRYVYETYGDQVILSLMNQYTPLPHVKAYPELDCRVKEKSYKKLIDYAVALGVTQAYTQSGEAVGESFIPSFECEGI